MSHKINKKWGRFDLLSSRITFMTISLMHDNPLLPILKNPYKILQAAGLKLGQKVVEIGCGPGFFTIPAASIVGDKGIIYAVDLNPFAIERVKKKIENKRIRNVLPMHTNAADTKLPDESIDLAFMFGLPYIVGGRENVISETYRILKFGGILSFKKSRGSERELIEETVKRGFTYSGKQGKLFHFAKEADGAGEA